MTLIYGESLPEELNTKIANFYAAVGKRGRAKSKKTTIGKTAKGKLKYALSAESIEKAGLAVGDQVEEIISGGQIIVKKEDLARRRPRRPIKPEGRRQSRAVTVYLQAIRLLSAGAVCPIIALYRGRGDRGVVIGGRFVSAAGLRAATSL